MEWTVDKCVGGGKMNYMGCDSAPRSYRGLHSSRFSHTLSLRWEDCPFDSESLVLEEG